MSDRSPIARPENSSDPVLRFECPTDTGVIGRLHLNVPRSLNALTIEGVRIMTAALAEWAVRADITSVVVTGEGARAFCAGGDVKTLQQLGPITEPGKDGLLHSDFFREEYVLNAMIAGFQKPYVSLLDGVVMGGGVGIAIMGSHRIGTETMKFGMPETAIGFFPDVGGGYFLSRLGALGTYLALTSLPITPAIAADVGITTHHILSTQRGAFEATLETRGLEAALAAFDQAPPPMTEQDVAFKALVTDAFSAERTSVESIFEVLDQRTDELAAKTAKAMRLRSPMAMKVTLEQLVRSRSLSFNQCLAMEFDMAQHHMVDSDFFEGVRAVLVDKDHKPQWNPSHLSEIPVANVQRFFAPLEKNRLSLQGFRDRP